jgi:nucleolin
MTVTRLFIGNIGRNVTEPMLVEALRAAGVEPQRARIATEKETGTPRGFGFIEIEMDAEAAIKIISGVLVNGATRPLRAERAVRQPDEDRQRGSRPPARDRGPGDGGSSRDGDAWREEMRGKRGSKRSGARW